MDQLEEGRWGRLPTFGVEVGPQVLAKFPRRHVDVSVSAYCNRGVWVQKVK